MEKRKIIKIGFVKKTFFDSFRVTSKKKKKTVFTIQLKFEANNGRR